MSLEGYKPLDLSSLQIDPTAFLQTPSSTGTDRASIAEQILAKTNWTPTAATQSTANKKNKTLISRIFDILSVGNYASANAVDNMLTQGEKKNQNPLTAGIKTDIAGAKGVAEGLLASLKGGFGTDDVANDPANKIHYSDVLMNHTSKGKDALDPNSGMSESERKNVVRGFAISGLGLDIAADPLTYFGIGGVSKAKSLAELPKVFEAAGRTAGLSKVSKTLQGEKNTAETLGKLNDTGIGSLANKTTTTVETPNVPSNLDWGVAINDLPEGAPNVGIPGSKDPGGLVAKIHPAVTKLGNPERRLKVAGNVLKDALKKGDGWGKVVKLKLAKSFPGLDFGQTHLYIDHMSQNPNVIKDLINNPQSRKRFTEAISRTIEADFRRVRPVVKAEDVPKNVGNVVKAPYILEAIKNGSESAAKAAEPVATPAEVLKTANMKIAADVIKKYKNQVETGMYDSIKGESRARLTQAIANGKTHKWTGPKQVNMWQSILNRIPRAGKTKYNEALRTLQHVEDSFMALGHTPYSAARKAESIPLRLSDVIAKIGPELFMKNPNHATILLRSALAGGEIEASPIGHAISQAVEAAKAGAAITEAGAVGKGVDAAAKAATVAENAGGSAARTADAITIAAKSADDIAKIAGAKLTGTASSIIKSMFNKSDPIEGAISASRFNTKIALTEGKLGKYSNVQGVSKAIAQSIDSPAPSVLGRSVGPNSRALDWLGARFNAAYKNADMRPVYLQEAATARSSVAKRAAVWNDAVRKLGRDPEMWGRAFKAAQGLYHPLLGSPESEAAKLILKHVEDMVGSSGLRAGAELENTVAGRAQLLMPELNENLLRYGIKKEFTKGTVKNGLGQVQDFSKGSDWLHSWQTWEISDPLHFMMRLQNAVENTVREANMFAEIGARWGTARAAKGYTSSVAHPRLAGIKFQPEMADQVRTFIKNLDEVKKPNSKMMQNFDSVMSKWKASVTIYMPSHHIRNMIGDTYFNWIAGVNGTKPYSVALKTLSSQKSRYTSIDTIGELTSPNAVMKAMERAQTGETVDKGTNVAFTMKNGQKVTHDMLYTSAFQEGTLPSARILEDVPDDAMLFDKIRPFNGKVQGAAHNLAEYREHFIRLAHFSDVLMKSPKNFPEAVKDAAAAVRKWHPDGMDMTTFERHIMRRVFPFYSWTRKAFPLTVESLVMKPGKVAIYPKVQGGLQGAIQGQQVNWADPFPEDQLFPDWIREKGIGPLTGAAGSYGMINPSNPTLDVISQFSDPKKGIGSMLNPAARIPAEILTGTEASTGAPITSYPDYATKQIPGISTVGRVTNIGLGGPTKKFASQGGMNQDAMLNLILAAGKMNTGPYQKQGEFDLRAYLKSRGGG